MRPLITYRLVDSPISTPCSKWKKYRASRTSWGINVLGSFFVEIEARDGTVGFATGFGGKNRLLPSPVPNADMMCARPPGMLARPPAL